MFPYKDENPSELTPVATVGIIALNLLSWALVQGLGAPEPLARSVCQLGLIPGEILGTAVPGTSIPIGPGMQCVITEEANWWTVLTSMFMHGGWFHLLTNLMFLWVFGNNIEDSMGHVRFVIFYLVGGLAAAGAQTLSDTRSVVPMVGASGAISGVLGGYLVLYPRVRIHTLVFLGFFMTTIALPAYVVLGYWIVLQVLGGTAAVLSRVEGGVAFWAHVGGFAAGFVLIKLFANPEFLERRRLRAEVGAWR